MSSRGLWPPLRFGWSGRVALPKARDLLVGQARDPDHAGRQDRDVRVGVDAQRRVQRPPDGRLVAGEHLLLLAAVAERLDEDGARASVSVVAHVEARLADGAALARLFGLGEARCGPEDELDHAREDGDRVLCSSVAGACG